MSFADFDALVRSAGKAHKTGWSTDLRLRVNQAVANAGTNVKAAGQAALDAGTADAYLAFLTDGLYVARARDCV